MSKISLILIFIIISSCSISDIEPLNSALTDFESFRNAAFNDEKSDVWFRLSYAVRDKITYKDFFSRWNEIKSNLKPIFDSEIMLIRETITGNNMNSKILKLKNKNKEFEFMLVAEFDNKRFPGEARTIWRIRGFTESKSNSVYGLFNLKE